MSRILVQKSGNKTLTYTIDDTGLLVQTKSRSKESEIHFLFENVKTNKVVALDHNKALLTLACVFGGITLLVLFMAFFDNTIDRVTIPFWGLISLVLFVVYFKTKQRKLFLQTSEHRSIDFIISRKNEKTVNEFVDMLLQERNIYLVSKYAVLSRHVSYATQLENLNWLLNNKAYSKSQYDEKIKELNVLFNGHPNNNPIGFIPGN
ncbi:MAG: hypothetical protein EKK37_10510 [Sphingobacteriales bacterium]|nr:MAG: hypothetical protein EKK37_10510 [Sphingobacteriales bacterium]